MEQAAVAEIINPPLHESKTPAFANIEIAILSGTAIHYYTKVSEASAVGNVSPENGLAEHIEPDRASGLLANDQVLTTLMKQLRLKSSFATADIIIKVEDGC
ncbi:MAG TPA: hypothetical protein VKA49_08205 [Flavitalea sp.]|nr:hypothetical protein [Flavitalea sp.]